MRNVLNNPPVQPADNYIDDEQKSQASMDDEKKSQASVDVASNDIVSTPKSTQKWGRHLLRKNEPGKSIPKHVRQSMTPIVLNNTKEKTENGINTFGS